MYLYFFSYSHHRYLHSFPTRRSSDLLIFIFLIIMSGFFSGSEMAFISANRLNLEVESRKDSWTGKAVKHFMRNPETFLTRSEEHTSELQSRGHLVCRLLL